MKFKEGVKVHGLVPELLLAIIVADRVYKEHGQELVITSIVDGNHSHTSLHYAGSAFDGRTRYFSQEIQEMVRAEIRDRLPVDYDVILEKSHLHIEYQPRR